MRIRSLSIALALSSFMSIPAYSFQAVFLVRHAEKETSGKDPELSPEGKKRADALAQHLKSSDIAQIYTTGYKRTQNTAAPLAKALNVKPQIQEDMKALAQTIKADKSDKNLLVVGHSNTVPELIQALGVKAKVEIGEAEFDRLFIVAVSEGSTPTLVTVRY